MESVRFMMHKVMCTVYDAQCRVNGARCTMQCKVYDGHNVGCMVHYAQCEVYGLLCTVY